MLPQLLYQAFGGGRAARRAGEERSTLVLNYKRQAQDQSNGIHSTPVLYSVDFHPYDGHYFIVGSMDGNVRLFGLDAIIFLLKLQIYDIFGTTALNHVCIFIEVTLTLPVKGQYNRGHGITLLVTK